MTKTKMTMLTVAVAAVVSMPVVLQQQANSRLRHDLAEVREENARLQESQAQASQAPAQSADTAANENASQTPQANLELIRLRAAATRGAAAEAELTQLKAELQRVRASVATRVGGGGGGPGAGPSADALAEYIGKPVDAPAEIAPAYTKDGLINALQTAAQKAGVTLKKVTVEDSEYPFLAGVICEKAVDFEKMKAEFKKMEGYEYGGSVSSDTCYAFNLVPSRVFPAEQSQSIQRRIILRQQRFYHDLNL